MQTIAYKRTSTAKRKRIAAWLRFGRKRCKQASDWVKWKGIPMGCPFSISSCPTVGGHRERRRETVGKSGAIGACWLWSRRKRRVASAGGSARGVGRRTTGGYAYRRKASGAPAAGGCAS